MQTERGRTRRLAVAVCAVSVGWLTTACSPAVEGTSGVRLDGDGGVVAVLAWCSGFEPAQLAVYTATLDGHVDDSIIILKRTGDAPPGSTLELDIAHPPPGWEAEQTAQLDDSGTYEIRVWNADGSGRVRSFPFQLEELRSPSATGAILTKHYVDEDGYQSLFLTSEEFQERAEQQCDA